MVPAGTHSMETETKASGSRLALGPEKTAVSLEILA
jgi:hypothetical protein